MMNRKASGGKLLGAERPGPNLLRKGLGEHFFGGVGKMSSSLER